MHKTGPLLIVAGAGSGKTRVLAYRSAQLVGSGAVRPYHILALTFTNKAAGELRGRTEAMIGNEGSLIVAGTFHSVFARILRQEGLNIGVDPRFTIVDADDRKRLVKTIMKDMGILAATASPADVTWLIERAKNALLTPPEFQNVARRPLEMTAAQVYERYQHRLERMAGLDFDDLLMKPVLAFRKYPEFLERLQNRFRQVMVDEFQDTNPAQYLLVKSIAEKHRNLCVVGDDDQAIYGFRGATVGNILDFKRDWPEVKVIRLEQNYRSHKFILDLAWSVIKHNPNRHEKKLWTSRKDGEPATLVEARSDEEEALRFTAVIQEEKIRHGRSLSDFAILYRTNAQSLPFERTLRAAGVPYQVIGGLKFYERKEIKDILAYLRILVNPADDISLERIINYPPRAIGATLVEELSSRARAEGRTLFEIVRLTAVDPSTTKRHAMALGNFVRLADELGEINRSSAISDLVAEVIVRTDLRNRLREEEKDDPSRAESKIENLDSFMLDIQRFQALNPDRSIADFLEEVSLVTEIDRLDPNQERVNLLTIHTAKGLEFPVVLIGGLEEGLMPFSFEGSSPDVEEERRLFFVGATRAMQRLVLGYAVERLRFGNRLWGGPSRFLAEIPPELLVGTSRSYQRSSPVRSIRPSEPIHYQPAAIAQPGSSGSGLQLDDLRNGVLVKHPTFGLGIIVDFRKQGLDSRLEVDFDSVGQKTLIFRYARLERGI